MTNIQSRMARAGLGWSIAKLSDETRISSRTIITFEKGGTVSAETVEALRATLVAAGATFLDKSGKVGALVKP